MPKKKELEKIETWKLLVVRLMQQDKEWEKLRKKLVANKEPNTSDRKFEIVKKMLKLDTEIRDNAFRLAGELMKENKVLRKRTK